MPIWNSGNGEGSGDASQTTLLAVKTVTDSLPNGGSLSSLAQDTTVAKDATVAKAVTLSLPAQNSINNSTTSDVIGNKTDDEDGDSIFAHAYIQKQHTHSVQKVYPTLANGVLVTGAAGAWGLGAFVVIVPANTITTPFDIHHINIAAFNANDTFELVLYAGPDGGEVEIGRVRFTRLSNTGASPHVVMMTPIIAANTQIKAKLATQAGTSNTVTASLIYHTY